MYFKIKLNISRDVSSVYFRTLLKDIPTMNNNRSCETGMKLRPFANLSSALAPTSGRKASFKRIMLSSCVVTGSKVNDILQILHFRFSYAMPAIQFCCHRLQLAQRSLFHPLRTDLRWVLPAILVNRRASSERTVCATNGFNASSRTSLTAFESSACVCKTRHATQLHNMQPIRRATTVSQFSLSLVWRMGRANAPRCLLPDATRRYLFALPTRRVEPKLKQRTKT